MEIERKKENGSIVIDSKAIEDIAEITTKKIADVYPAKEEGFASCKTKNDELIVEISVRLPKGIDIDKICREIQKNVFEHIYEMTSIKVQHVDVMIQGFVTK